MQLIVSKSAHALFSACLTFWPVELIFSVSSGYTFIKPQQITDNLVKNLQFIEKNLGVNHQAGYFKYVISPDAH
jgi:hypothetical protein